MKKEYLIQNPENPRRHVVLLGAGASRAAFPNGDANGKKIPLMNDFAETLQLTTTLVNAEIDPTQNFEFIYSNIEEKSLRSYLEKQIEKYFLSFSLPDTATDYDRLVLSLRGKDAIFTFNWDPFLFDAWLRNCKIAKLPEIFFLHGNVRIGACIKDGQWGRKWDVCPKCDGKFFPVPLLYPVGDKDYSDKANEYIKNSWNNAKIWFANAFTLTIFGYSSPASDTKAVNLLNTSWLERSTRQLEHIEIIDIANSQTIHEHWNSFTPTNHYSLESNLSDSRILQWPRRTCEAIYYPMTKGVACEAFPLTSTNNLEELQKQIIEIAKYEFD